MAQRTNKKTAPHQGRVWVDGVGWFDFYTCGNCGVTWGIPCGLKDARQHDHEAWYCPNGHHWYFSGENTEEKLRRERNEARDRAAAAAAQRDQAEASLRATKGVVTKQRKQLTRVRSGVCPCCNRTFKQLARHMESQHPEYKP